MISGFLRRKQGRGSLELVFSAAISVCVFVALVWDGFSEQSEIRRAVFVSVAIFLLVLAGIRLVTRAFSKHSGSDG